MRRYETIFITNADLSEEDINGLVERYSAIVKDLKGTVIKIDKWGKRKLAYEINKHSRGYYVLIDYAGSAAIVTELERNLRIGEQILKFMTVKTQETVNLQDLEQEMKPVAAEVKAEPVPAAEHETAASPESVEAAGAGEAPAPERKEEE